VFVKPKRKVTKIYIHCSASDNPEHDDIKVITRWHLARRFKWVGYHYFITSQGEVQKGRDLEKMPAAQKGHNKDSIAICVSGLSSFTEKSLFALKQLCLDIDDEYDSQVTFHGHCEVSAKRCPVFDYKAVLNLGEQGHIKYERETLTIKDIPIIKYPIRVRSIWQKILNLFKF